MLISLILVWDSGMVIVMLVISFPKVKNHGKVTFMWLLWLFFCSKFGMDMSLPIYSSSEFPRQWNLEALTLALKFHIPALPRLPSLLSGLVAISVGKQGLSWQVNLPGDSAPQGRGSTISWSNLTGVAPLCFCTRLLCCLLCSCLTCFCCCSGNSSLLLAPE